MLLWVGLGNPEAAMAKHRHNIGFMAIDTIAHRHGFSPWRQRFKGWTAEGNVGRQPILHLNPGTYMNGSGESVQAAAGFHKLPPSEITAFHDELDLAPGKVRVKLGGGAAGHNGLRSITAHCGNDYRRVRIGIGHPGDKASVAPYVLSRFGKSQAPWGDRLCAGCGHHAAL